MTPMLLVYSLPQEKLAKLRFMCLRLGVKVIAVDECDHAQPMGALCGMAERIADPAPVEALAEEMMVMANFTTTLANRLLSALKQGRLHIRLKAVVTPTNVAWNAVQLQKELQKERQAIAEGGKAGHGDE